jgi:hypothetical protein
MWATTLFVITIWAIVFITSIAVHSFLRVSNIIQKKIGLVKSPITQMSKISIE